MAKAKFNLIKTIEGKFPTDIWYCEDKQVFDVWRNHKKIFADFHVEKSYEDTLAYLEDFIFDINKKCLDLNYYLDINNLKLTKLEIETLEAILGEGSFYEENGELEREYGGFFIGWDIDEKEVPGCRGAISSLVRKGILTVGSDEVNCKVIQCYWIGQKLKFKEDGYYHQLDIPAELIK